MSKIISVLLAALLSFALFVGMNLLIEPNQAEASPVEKTPPIIITIDIIDDEPIIRKWALPEKPDVLKIPPVTKTVIEADEQKTKVAVADIKLPKIKGHGIDGLKVPSLVGGAGIGGGTPRVRINPAYPRIAATNNIEGFVTLIYDITPMGTIENIRVVEANPRGIFERNAKRALLKWKYSPKIVDNKAVGIFGESVTLQFRLEQDVL